MNIDEILEEMDELLDKAPSVPILNHRRLVDADRLRELINDVRLNLPSELKEAKKIEYDCQRILNEANIEAKGIVRRAEEQAALIASKETIVVEAKKKALEVIKKTQASTNAIQRNAAETINQIYSDAEKYYLRSLQEVKAAKANLANVVASNANNNLNSITGNNAANNSGADANNNNNNAQNN